MTDWERFFLRLSSSFLEELNLKSVKTFHLTISSALLLILVIIIFTYQTAIAAEGEYVNLPIPRQFVPASQSDGAPEYVSGPSIETAIRKVSPDLKKFYYNRNITRFIVPDHAWLVHLFNTYDAFLSKAGLKGKADTWDCENYSEMLNALTTLWIWRAGYLDTRAAVGWLLVDAKKSWAGLPGVMHALMIAVTNEGIFVIEPQNGQQISLSEYPNRQYIQEVNLF